MWKCPLTNPNNSYFLYQSESRYMTSVPFTDHLSNGLMRQKLTKKIVWLDFFVYVSGRSYKSNAKTGMTKQVSGLKRNDNIWDILLIILVFSEHPHGHLQSKHHWSLSSASMTAEKVMQLPVARQGNVCESNSLASRLSYIAHVPARKNALSPRMGIQLAI